MVNIFESSVDSEFKIEMTKKLDTIKEKLVTIVKFKEDIATEGLKTLEKVIIIYIILFILYVFKFVYFSCLKVMKSTLFLLF